MCPMWVRVSLCDSMLSLSDPRPPHNSHNSPLLKAHSSPANERQAQTLRGQSEAVVTHSPKICRLDNDRPVITSSRFTKCSSPRWSGDSHQDEWRQDDPSSLSDYNRCKFCSRCLDISISVLIFGTCWVSRPLRRGPQTLRWTNTD